MAKHYLKYVFIFLLVPVLILGIVIYPQRSYAVVSVIIILFSCIPFFLSFEKNSSTRRIVLLAVMTSLSVAGRFIFAPIPFFKPVTAIVVISGMYFGCEFGFLTGALSAVISNFYFGQGAWTPFQMFSWGVIGFIAGLLSDKLIRNKIILVIYAVFSGILYSMLMDVWTVLWMDGVFNPVRFFGAVITALPVTAQYIVSNIIFLLILTPVIGKKIERLKTKYEI